MIKNYHLKNKIAVVTGITGDIGQAIFKALSAEEIKVIGISSNSIKKNRIIKKLKEDKNVLDIIKCDLSDEKNIEKTCKQITKKYKQIDILINNAATLNLKNLENFGVKEISNIFNVNILAPIFLTRYFIKKMKKNKSGNVINICSSSSYHGGGKEGHTVYSATKHALLGFSRALDEEVRKSNIRVSSISPAGVNTKMMQKRLKNSKDISRNSLMTTREVSDALIFLLKSNGRGIVYEMRLSRMFR